MKKLIYILAIIGFVIVGCGTQQQTTVATNEEKEEPVRIANDSLEYEITIIDLGFTNYLATAKPESYYNQSSLETRNRVLVMEWNNRFRRKIIRISNIST